MTASKNGRESGNAGLRPYSPRQQLPPPGRQFQDGLDRRSRLRQHTNVRIIDALCHTFGTVLALETNIDEGLLMRAAQHGVAQEVPRMPPPHCPWRLRVGVIGARISTCAGSSALLHCRLVCVEVGGLSLGSLRRLAVVHEEQHIWLNANDPDRLKAAYCICILLD